MFVSLCTITEIVAKELKEQREVLDPEKEARLAKVDEIYKQEALERLSIRTYTNPDPKTSPVEGEFSLPSKYFL